MMSDPQDSIDDLAKLFDKSDLTSNEDPKIWLRLVRDKLYTMFRSPMKEDFTHEAFKWVARLCISLDGFSWINLEDQWTKEVASVFSIIVRLSMAELDIVLPLMSRHITEGHQDETDAGKLMARSANEEEYNRFGDLLIIIESAIKSLLDEQRSDDGHDDQPSQYSLAHVLEAEDLQGLLEKLKDSIMVLCDYLELVNTNWINLYKELDSHQFISAEGALRIVCVWLAEEPDSLQSYCERFLIELIVKNLLLPDRDLKDMLLLALHSVCTTNDEMKQKLISMADHKQALDNYLEYAQAKHVSDIGSVESREKGEKMFKLRCGLVKDMTDSN